MTLDEIHQGIAAALQRSDGDLALRGLLRETFDHCAGTDPPLVGVKVHEVTWQLDADLEPPPPKRIEVASYAPVSP